MRFLLDNNLAPKHAKALDALVTPLHTVIHLREKFAEDAPDEEWLAKLVEEGSWVVISGDVRIGKHKHQREIWQSSKLILFFLAKGWSNLPLMMKHAKLSQSFDTIIETAERAKPGSGFLVQANGKIVDFYSA